MMNPDRFLDGADAGRRLAGQLGHLAGRDDLLVLALPRGGVPVGYEVARTLGAPLDIIVVRKLGVPGYEELAMGAIAAGGACVLNPTVLGHLHDAEAMLKQVIAREVAELERREREYRAGRPPPEVRGRSVILVDDGLATGATMRAAVAAVREQSPSRIVVAVPVGDPEVCARLRAEVDEVICVETPAYFEAVGQFYENFEQTDDEEVRTLLARAAARV